MTIPATASQRLLYRAGPAIRMKHVLGPVGDDPSPIPAPPLPRLGLPTIRVKPWLWS